MTAPAPEPSPRSPRRTRAEQTEFYERVVQTSLQLFFDGGYEAISMRRLAAEVGVPPMSLYRYFPTKTHLVRHLWDEILDKAYQRATRDLKPRGLPVTRLRTYIDGYLTYWLENRAHYWVVFAIRDDGNATPEDDGAYLHRPNPQRIVAALEELVGACMPDAQTTDQERRLLIEHLFCKALGFLLGTIGLSSLRWTDVTELKRRCVNDMVEHVLSSASGRGSQHVRHEVGQSAR